MNLKPFSGWTAAAGLLAIFLCAPAGHAEAAPRLDNATCLSCHDGRKGKLEIATAEGASRELRSVAADALRKSVHASMDCVTCHTDIQDNAESGNAHHKDPVLTAARKDCIACHEDLWQTVKKENRAKDWPRLGVVAENIVDYKGSLHARPNQDDPTHANATCEDCHSSHSFNVPPKNSPDYAEWRLGIPKACGTECHEESLETYVESIHGRKVLEKHDVKAAVCTDCHTTHAIGNTSATRFKLAITAQCGNCHEENFKSYKATYHGQINTLGYTYTAKCYDCHGSHGKIGRAHV